MLFRLALAFFLFVPGTAVFAKDDCQRNDEIWHDKLEGYNPGGIQFKFESRVQKFSSTAFRYIWCIENKSSAIAHFLWGTRDVENRYFDALVRPGSMEPTIRTDSSGTLKEQRIIKYTPKDAEQWQKVQPEPETIFFRRSAELIPLNDTTPRLRLAQTNLDQALSPFKTADGLIDLATLSRNSDLFAQFVAQEKTIDFWYTSVATIPSNYSTLDAIEQSKYEKYNPSDFASLRIVVHSQIQPAAGIDHAGRPISRIEISTVPATPEDGPRLERASELPYLITIKELGFQQKVFPRFSKVLFERPTGPLSYSSVLVTVMNEKTGKKLFSMPIELLVPGQAS